VEATAAEGKSRWQREGHALGFELCQTIKNILVDQGEHDRWSRRARERMTIIREEFPWLQSDGSVIVSDSNGTVKWWTFAGGRANATLANEIGTTTRSRVQHDNFAVGFTSDLPLKEIESAIAEMRSNDEAGMCGAVDEQAIEGLKFSKCVPKGLAIELLQERLKDSKATASVLANPVRFVRGLDSNGEASKIDH
jgi:ATP-dependent helicase Lhr and Lhr-like helicase